MNSVVAFEDQVLSEIRQMVLPQRFPPRRDLEVAGAVAEAGSRLASSFFDVFWPKDGLLAAVVGRVAEDGVGGALRASSLQRLSRAVLALRAPAEAEPILAALYEDQFPGGRFDLALVTLDARTGACRVARRGAGTVGGLDAATADAPLTAQPGDVLWLATGLSVPDGRAARDDLALGVEDMVRGAVAFDGAGGAVLAIDVKARAKGDAVHSFTMANDVGAIAGLAGRVEALFAEAGVPDAVSAAFGLSLDEVLTNTVSYGFADGGRHEILVEIALGEGEVQVEVRDDGRPFDPLSVAPPDLDAPIEEREVGGLGIHFVRTLLDGLDYRREGGWNILTLRKKYAEDCDGNPTGG